MLFKSGSCSYQGMSSYIILANFYDWHFWREKCSWFFSKKNSKDDRIKVVRIFSNRDFHFHLYVIIFQTNQTATKYFESSQRLSNLKFCRNSCMRIGVKGFLGQICFFNKTQIYKILTLSWIWHLLISTTSEIIKLRFLSSPARNDRLFQIIRLKKTKAQTIHYT